MDFTGERYMPAIGGEIACEHLHRYGVCLEAATGKRVLDVASGEGYGSSMIARVASTVIGVDVSAEAVAHASELYAHQQNLRFVQASATSIPLESGSLDLVISFETIEHLGEHEEMIAEVDRLLAPDGVLIISTPEKAVYSDRTGYKNSFHVRELYEPEFCTLLSARFPHIRMYYQRMVSSSWLWPADGKELTALTQMAGSAEGVQRRLAAPSQPMYLVAVCARTPAALPKFEASQFVHAESDVWLSQHDHALAAENARGRERAALLERIRSLEEALSEARSGTGASEGEKEPAGPVAVRSMPASELLSPSGVQSGLMVFVPDLPAGPALAIRQGAKWHLVPTAATNAIKGNFDGFDHEDFAYGWVNDPGHGPAEIVAFIDDVEVGSFTADRPRQDLAEVGLPSCSYRFPIPAEFHDGRRHGIRLIERRTGLPLTPANRSFVFPPRP